MNQKRIFDITDISRHGFIRYLTAVAAKVIHDPRYRDQIRRIVYQIDEYILQQFSVFDIVPLNNVSQQNRIFDCRYIVTLRFVVRQREQFR